MQIPDKPVGSPIGGEALWRTNPVGGHIEIGLNGFDRIRARETADHFSRVQNIQHDGAGGTGTESIVDDGSIGRILSGGLLRRQRRISVLVASETVGELGLE